MSKDAWDHLELFVAALVQRGNVALDGGFLLDQSGVQCRMRDPLDFHVLEGLLRSDPHNVQLVPEHDAVLCHHCWGGISGPGR